MTSAQAYRVFEAVRWPGGRPSRCPHCSSTTACRLLVPRDGTSRSTRTGARTHRRVWRCGACRRQFSVLTGSVFEGTRVPLGLWLSALSLLKDGRRDVHEVADATGVHRDTARSMVELTAAGFEYEGAQPQG